MTLVEQISRVLTVDCGFYHHNLSGVMEPDGNYQYRRDDVRSGNTLVSLYLNADTENADAVPGLGMASGIFGPKLDRLVPPDVGPTKGSDNRFWHADQSFWRLLIALRNFRFDHDRDRWVPR